MIARRLKPLARVVAILALLAACAGGAPEPVTGAGVVVDYGSVWVTSNEKSELYQVNPKTNAVASIIPLDRSPRFVSSGEDSIWVFTQGDGTVQRIDGKTGRVTATIETGRAGVEWGDMASGGGYVWLSTTGMPWPKSTQRPTP
jgi:streptogramin lyase